MKQSRDFWQVTVRTTSEAGKPVSALMEGFFHQPPWTYTDEGTQATDVSVCVFAKRDCAPARIAKLKAALTHLRKHGVNTGPARVRVKRVRQQDWSESWKRHFKPLDIDGRLLVRPSWSRRKPKAGQVVITLDPGLSFGTGHHPTTAYCLRELVRSRKRGRTQSFLDIGTGSGLLAIAAAKLGYAPVVAFDNDPESMRVAGENLAINDVTGQVDLSVRDLSRQPLKMAQRFDLVCANLLAALLIEERERIMAGLAPGGRLVMAGILSKQFAEVRKAYASAGLRLVRSRSEKEWHSGTFAPGEACT